MSRKKTPWQRIMRAAEKGTGVHLSADDVFRLSMDDAILTRAQLDDEQDQNEADDLNQRQEAWKHV